MRETVIDEGLKIEDIKSQVMTYVKAKLPIYQSWADSNFEDHVSFYMNLGQLLVSQDDSVPTAVTTSETL
ncbi:MAG: hypothetical protein ACO3CL_08590, partial [Bacteroidia bacterium]